MALDPLLPVLPPKVVDVLLLVVGATAVGAYHFLLGLSGARVTLLVVAKGLGRREAVGALVTLVTRPVGVMGAFSVEIELRFGIAHLGVLVHLKSVAVESIIAYVVHGPYFFTDVTLKLLARVHVSFVVVQGPLTIEYGFTLRALFLDLRVKG